MSTSGLKGYINNGEYTAHYQSHDAYPSGLGLEFYKDCKRGFIDTIYDNRTTEVVGFIKNSLFCEWAYFYDHDNKIFEIWKGFQKEPDSTNPFGQECDEDGYYPCRRIFRGDINSINEDIFADKDIISLLLSIERDQKLTKIL
jgi:hypothetical protein